MSKEIEIRFKVDADWLEQLKKKLNLSSAREVTEEALTLLNWAAQETRDQRVILSANKDGSDVHRLVTPALSRAEKNGDLR